MVQAPTSHRWQQPLPTMYDLPSEDPEEPGLPDEFHTFQPTLLTETCRSPQIPLEDCFTAQDLNLYYDPRHTLWHKRPDWFLVLGATRVEQQADLRW
ncbi:MAG: Uma2 family endonuclease, partial [Spirulinaceae cyanobacterium]